MGGGALMTPFLIFFLNLNPAVAVGTDLVFAAITKIGGGYQHYRQKTLRLRPIFWMALGSLPASYLGARYIISQAGNQQARHRLLLMLGVVLGVVGVISMMRALGWIAGKITSKPVWPKPWALVIIGALGGGLVGMTSIGGGTVIMALLLVFFTIPADKLIGLDVSHGAILALFTASTYALSGHVDWSVTGWLLAGSLPGVWLGARAVTKIPQKYVQAILGVVLLLAGAIIVFG